MSIVDRCGAQVRSTRHPCGRNPGNRKFDPAIWSVADNFLAIALSGIDVRRLISDMVAFKDVLAEDYEPEEVTKKLSVFGGPCLNITSRYAMRIR